MNTIRVCLAAVPFLCLLSSPSFATTKEEAQKKVDEIKAKQCESVKTYLNAQKDSCPDEASAAANISCSAAAFTDVQALNSKCSEKIKSKTGAIAASAKMTPTPEPGSMPKDQCQATDDTGKVLAQHTSADYGECANALKEEVKKQKCTDGVKNFKYNFQRGSFKPFPSYVYCN